MKDRGFEHVRAPKAAETDETPPDRGGEQQQAPFSNSICSVCMNTRPNFGVVKEFTKQDLQFATNGFSQQNLLSHNRKIFYGGISSDGAKVVVRRRALGAISEAEFMTRVQMLGNAKHENVALLLGYHSEGPERFLIYEYVCNSSLNTHLTCKKC